MATSPFSNDGNSSGIWSVIIIVTYIHGEFSSAGLLVVEMGCREEGALLDLPREGERDPRLACKGAGWDG